VIAHIFDDNLGHFFVEPKGQFQCKFGLYFHDTIVGKPFGTKIYNHKETGYVHFLKFSPILWTKSLNHRTQILFETNISMILMYLNIRPGDRIVESGTGSGSLSTSFASAISPNGHLFTFEFNQERFESAKKEFVENGFGEVVTITHCDVITNGFQLDSDKKEQIQYGTIDAVFLDLPKPWECLEHVNKVLKRWGRFCAFSPCIEQVQQTCKKLALSRYYDLKTIECLERNFSLSVRVPKSFEDFNGKLKNNNTKVDEYLTIPNEMRGHTGYLTFATKTI